MLTMSILQHFKSMEPKKSEYKELCNEELDIFQANWQNEN